MQAKRLARRFSRDVRSRPGGPFIESRPSLSFWNRALQAIVVATLAIGIVLGGGFLSGAMFDGLPKFLDVVLVVFVFPFVLLIGALLVDAKLITPRWPGWLRKSDGHEADTPGLLIGAVLAASLAAIYPGMFPARTYANLVLWGPAFDVTPESAPADAAYYRFTEAELRPSLGGSRSRTVTRPINDVTERITVETHVAPIVGVGWSADREVTVWAVREDDVLPWGTEALSSLEGIRLSDERDHALRAVEEVARERGLALSKSPILVELGDTYAELLSTSQRRTWMVLLPLCLVVFVGVGARTWLILRPNAE